MPLALFTTLALAMPCPCELVGWNDSLEAPASPDWLRVRQLFPKEVSPHSAGLTAVMHPVIEDVRSHHLAFRDLPSRDSGQWPVGVPHAQRAQSSFLPATQRYVKKAQKMPVPAFSPAVPAVLMTPPAPAENASMGEAVTAAAEANTESSLEDAKATTAEGLLPVEAAPEDLVDVAEADALRTDDLEIGVEAVIPPPVPIEEIQADLLEVLGLDSQVLEPPRPQPQEVPPWAATIYGGRFTSDDLGPALIGNLSGFEDSALVGFGLARTVAGRRPLSLEVEGQILQHFGNQGHSEGTVALVLRWHDFPWDDKIDTTFAIGEGLSFATSVPELEIRRNGRSTQLLNYLLFELTFALPQEPDWQFVGRLHHRSGVYGLFDGVGSGSNVYSAGIRRRF